MTLLMFLISAAFAQNPSIVRENNSAVDLIEKDRDSEAKEKLEKSAVNHPNDPVLAYNLGLAYSKSENPDKALQSFNAAAGTAKDPELKFRSLFNAAKIYEEQKKVPDAVKAYQAALDLKPDSQEVKQNLELMLQKKSGGGSGEKQDQNQGGNDQQQNPNQEKENKPGENKQYAKNQTRQFKSEKLSQQDVNKILEELQRQEDKIRGKVLSKKSKEPRGGKDW